MPVFQNKICNDGDKVQHSGLMHDMNLARVNANDIVLYLIDGTWIFFPVIWQHRELFGNCACGTMNEAMV